MLKGEQPPVPEMYSTKSATTGELLHHHLFERLRHLHHPRQRLRGLRVHWLIGCPHPAPLTR